MCKAFLAGKNIVYIKKEKEGHWSIRRGEVTQNEGGEAHRPSSDFWSHRQLKMNFQVPILSALPKSPLDEGIEALITAFGNIIEHPLYPLLTLLKVQNPLVQPFAQNDLTEDKSKSAVVCGEGNHYFLRAIYRRLPWLYRYKRSQSLLWVYFSLLGLQSLHIIFWDELSLDRFVPVMDNRGKWLTYISGGVSLKAA